MRILFQHDSTIGNGNFPPRIGLCNVFIALNHTVIHWDMTSKNCFDAFSEADPVDLFIGQTYNCSRAVTKCIAIRPEMRVIMQASSWGDLISEINLKENPILVPTDEEKGVLSKLKKETGKPDFVYQNYATRWVKSCLGKWESEAGIPAFSNLNAADYYKYNKGVACDKFKSDVNYVGGKWPYKSATIDKFLVPLLHNDTAPKNPLTGEKISVKIWGNQGWQGYPQYLGYATEEDLRHIFASSTCIVNVHESHSNQYGFDCVERPFKVFCSKGLPISDYVESFDKDIFPNGEMPFYKTYDELTDLIQYFITKPNVRLQHIENGYNTVLKHHTYHNRVSDILSQLQLTQEKVLCDKLHKTIVEKEL